MLTTRAIAANRTAGEGVRRGDAAAPARSAGDSGGFLAAFVMASEAARAPPTAQPTTARSPMAEPTTTQEDSADGDAAVDGAPPTAPPPGRRDGAVMRRPVSPDVAGLPAAAPGPTATTPEPGTSRLASVKGQSSSHDSNRDLRHPPQPVAAGAIVAAAQAVVPAAIMTPGASAAGSRTSAVPGSPGAPADPGDAAARAAQGTRSNAPTGDSALASTGGSAVRAPGPTPAAGIAAAANNTNVPAPAAVADIAGAAVAGLAPTTAVVSVDGSGGPALDGRSPAPSAAAGNSGGQVSASRLSPLQFPPLRAAPPATAPAGTVSAGPAVPPLGGVAVGAAPARPAVRSGDDGGFGAALSGAGAGGVGLAATAASVVTPAAPSQPGTAGPDADATGLAEQVAHHLVGALGAGQMEVMLRLHPPELGELNVRLQVAGHEVSAWFDSPLPQVQQVLSQGMGQLQAGLANAGYNLNGAWVGGDAWTPRGRTAPVAARPTRLPGAMRVEAAPGTGSPTAGRGVSLYV